MKKVTLSKVVHKGEARIRVDFPYDATIIQTIKQLNGSRWSQSKKCWHLPYSKEMYALLQQHFEVSLSKEVATMSSAHPSVGSELMTTNSKSSTVVEETIQLFLKNLLFQRG